MSFIKCLILACVLFSTSAFATPKAITIGFVPGENPNELQSNGEALAKLLQPKLGVDVKVYIPKNYSDLIDAMKSKKIDFAFFSAATFVFAEKMAGAKVLLKKVWTGPYYYAAILSRKSTNLKQLKGKSFAFVDEKSTSGYLYPLAYFKKQNIDPKTYFSQTLFTGHHPDSVNALDEGKADAIAVYSNDEKAKDTAWDRFTKTDKKHRPRAIWVSGPIPNDPFCVRQDFYDTNTKIATDVMFALRDLSDEKDSQLNKLLGVNGLMLATSQQYDPVREMVKSLDLKLDDH